MSTVQYEIFVIIVIYTKKRAKSIPRVYVEKSIGCMERNLGILDLKQKNNIMK